MLNAQCSMLKRESEAIIMRRVSASHSAHAPAWSRISLDARYCSLRNRMTHRGYTLIEISIVLVIIGLIVGGVLVGQDLIRAAEIRSAVTQIGEYDAAIIVYRDRYGCMPGDDPKMPYLAHPALPSLKPNCDGRIRDRNDRDVFFEGDTNNVWSQLSESGLVKQTYNNRTAFFDGGSWKTGIAEFKLKANQGIGVVTSNGLADISGHANPQVFPSDTTVYFISNKGDGSNIAGNLYNTLATISPQLAYAFDSKMDDGKALAGRVRATNGWDVVGKPFDNSCPSCGGCVLSTDNNEYWTTSEVSSNGDCAFAIKLLRQ